MNTAGPNQQGVSSFTPWKGREKSKYPAWFSCVSCIILVNLLPKGSSSNFDEIFPSSNNSSARLSSTPRYSSIIGSVTLSGSKTFLTGKKPNSSK